MRQRQLWHVRKLTPTHILEVELKVSKQQKYKLLGINEHLRLIHNTVLGAVYNNYKQMTRTKEYRHLLRLYREEKLTKQQSITWFHRIYKKFNVNFTFVRKYGEWLRKHKFTNPDAVTTLSICEIVWKSMENLIFRGAKRVRFYKKGEFVVFQGKQASRSIILKEKFATHMRMNFPIIVKKNDLFVKETLSLVQKYRENSKEIDDSLINGFERSGSLKSTYRIRYNRIVDFRLPLLSKPLISESRSEEHTSEL